MDFSKSKIYRVVGGDEVYIGSTTRSLDTRWTEHKHDFKRGAKLTSCQILTKYGIDNCRLELIEEYPCASHNELREREAEIIKNTTCVNKKIPNRSRQEWDEKKDCECGGKYYASYKKKHKVTKRHIDYLSSTIK
jgi:hypothetical protein